MSFRPREKQFADTYKSGSHPAKCFLCAYSACERPQESEREREQQ